MEFPFDPKKTENGDIHKKYKILTFLESEMAFFDEPSHPVRSSLPRKRTGSDFNVQQNIANLSVKC